MPKITNEQKLQVIKDFLTKNGIAFTENHVSKWCGVTIPLAVTKHRVAVRIGDDDEFYHKTKGKYFPIFIRDTDTKAKVLEKIQNTIIKSMVTNQKKLNKQAKKNAKQG